MKRLLMPMLLVFAMGCPEGDDGETDPVDNTRVDDILALTGDDAAGMTTYSNLCVACHQADGTGGGSFPDLTTYVPTATDEAVLLDVIEGGTGMAAYGDQLDDQQLADLLAYLNSDFGG